MNLKRLALAIAASALALPQMTGAARAADSSSVGRHDRVSATQASGPVQPSLTQIRAVAERLWAGRPTASDEDFLMRNPDIAAALPDGRTIEIGVQSYPSPSATTMKSTAAARCHSADRYMNVSSPTGSRLYTYHSVIDSWCENGVTISSSRFHDYFSNINGTAMTNPKTGLIHELRKPAGNHWVAYVGGSIENCIFKIGCIGTKYPALQISHYAGKGSLTYQWYNKDDGSGWHHQ